MKRVRASNGAANGGTGSGTAGAAAAATKPFDLGGVRLPPQRDPQGRARSLAPRKRMFDLPEAPTYYPTAKEFADPLAYIQKIRPEAEARFRFRTRVQQLNSLEGKTRTNLNYLDQLYKFHAKQGNPLPKVPQLDHRPIDLFELRHQVTIRGGYQKVNREKRWAEIGRVMKYDRKSCTSMSTTLKATYTKVVMPFEFYVAKHGGNLPLSVDGASAAAAEDDSVGRRRSKRKWVPTEPTERDSSPSDSDIALSLSIYRNSSYGDNLGGTDDDDESSTTGESRFDSGPTSSLPERCELCKSGENDDKMLICDGCNRGFHMYCLRPPLTSIPTNDWYCDACILSAGADFGFEDGAEHTLESFKRKNDEFKRSFFASYYADQTPRRGPRPALWGPQMEGRVPEDKVEEEFWRLVASPFEDVEVEYGADLHSAQHGSGFPTAERDPTDPYAHHPWNLNVMPFQPASLFNYIKQDISGMKTPWIYVGMCFSTFCWHNEDHYTYSVNYMHWGDTKTWYGVPGRHAAQFEDAMRAAVPQLFMDQPDLLFQLVTMLSPGALVARNVDVVSCDQRAGEFVVTFPQSYHAGFNQGFNFNEAVNFATPDWMPYDVPSVQRYQQYTRNPVFSHDELVMTMCEADPAFVDQPWFQDAMLEMTRREQADRVRVRSLWPNDIREAAWEDVEEGDPDLPEEIKQQCYTCKAFSFLSAVVCGCTPNYISCLAHAEASCKCAGDQKVLKMRYSDRNLQDLAEKCLRRSSGDVDDEAPRAATVDPLPEAASTGAVHENGVNAGWQDEVESDNCPGNEDSSEAQVWEKEFRRVMAHYSASQANGAKKALSSPGTSTTAFTQPEAVRKDRNGVNLARPDREEDETITDDQVSVRSEQKEPMVVGSELLKLSNKHSIALLPLSKPPELIAKGTMTVAELNRRPDLMQMVLLLEEAQRLVLPLLAPNMTMSAANAHGGSQSAPITPRGGRGGKRGAKRRPGRPSNASRMLESLVAPGAKLGGAIPVTASQANANSGGGPLALLVQVIERLVTFQGGKHIPYSQALGDVRQLGRFVQRAHEWCRAAQALLLCAGKTQKVNEILLKRNENYNWLREKLHKRFGELLHDTTAAASVATNEHVESPAAGNHLASEKKRSLSAESDSSSSEDSGSEKAVDPSFKAKRPVGRPRGSKRGRVATSQRVVPASSRSESGRSLRSSKYSLRSEPSSDSRRLSEQLSPARSDTLLRGSSAQQSDAWPLGLGTLTQTLTARMHTSKLVAVVRRVLADSPFELHQDDADDDSDELSVSDLTALLRVGEQLYFNSPEFNALIEYELNVLNLEAAAIAIAESGPAVFEQLLRLPVVPAQSKAEDLQIAELESFVNSLTSLRDALRSAGVRVSRGDDVFDLAERSDWLYECHQQLARRSISPEDLSQLLATASELQIDRDSEPLRQLEAAQAEADKWDRAAADTIGLHAGPRNVLEVREVAKLLEKARNLLMLPSRYNELRQIQQTILDLQARTDQLVDRSERSDLVERPRYDEAAALVSSCGVFGRFEPSGLEQLRAGIAKVDSWRKEVEQLFLFNTNGGALGDTLAGVQYRLRQTLSIVNGADKTTTELCCACLRPESGLMVECNSCHEWYHPHCVNLDQHEIENLLFLCSLCDARARAERPRLLGDYPTLSRVDRAVMESRSFGLIAGALDPLVTILLDAQSLIQSLKHLLEDKQAERLKRSAFLRLLLRALLGLGINLKHGIVDNLWSLLSELTKDEPVPVITPGITVSSRRSPRSKPPHNLLAAEPEMQAQATAGHPLEVEDTPVQPPAALFPLQQQLEQISQQPGAVLVGDKLANISQPGEGILHPGDAAIYQSKLEDLALLIMHPPPVEQDVGQGLPPACDTFNLSKENCLCNLRGADLDADSSAMALVPTIECDDCTEYFHIDCVQVSIAVARIIAFNQMRIRVNADVDVDIPEEPSRYTCPGCCIKSGAGYPYGEVMFE